MAFVLPKDRVMETSITSGAGPYALAGAIDASFNRFGASMSIGDTTFGAIVEPGLAFWSGILTYSAANQITATTVSESKGTFGAGTKEVFMGLPANKALSSDDARVVGAVLSNASQSLTAAAQTQALSNLGAVPLILPKTSNYTVTAADRGKLISITVARGSSVTIATPAAAAVGAGFGFMVENLGYGQAIVDPNASETVDAKATINAFKGQPQFWVVSDGTNWRTIGRSNVFVIAETGIVASTANFTFTLPDALQTMALELNGLYPLGIDYLILRAGTGGGISVASEYAAHVLYTPSGTPTALSSTNTFFQFGTQQPVNGAQALSGRAEFSRLNGFGVSTKAGYITSAGSGQVMIGSGYMTTTTSVDTIRISATASNIGCANIALLGMAA